MLVIYAARVDCVSDHPRNLECGVWNGKDGFVGIRTKFGRRFLDMEIHWDLSEIFGTAQALEPLGAILNHSLWT